MRSDMAKVVTERPRRGHGDDSVKTSYTIRPKDLSIDSDGDYEDADYGPGRIKASRGGQCRLRLSEGRSMKMRGNHSAYDCHKEFSDLLGPLRGYLRKQVGRPWDKVYSELRANLDFRTVSGQHIWDHVKQEVELHTYMRVDGQVGELGRYGRVGVVDGLYVHPLTRLLCYRKKRNLRIGFWRDKPNPDVVKIDEVNSIERINGIWYYVRFGIVDVYVPARMTASGFVARPEYFEEKRVVQWKRQLSRRELRAHGLRNANAA